MRNADSCDGIRQSGVKEAEIRHTDLGGILGALQRIVLSLMGRVDPPTLAVHPWHSGDAPTAAESLAQTMCGKLSA